MQNWSKVKLNFNLVLDPETQNFDHLYAQILFCFLPKKYICDVTELF